MPLGKRTTAPTSSITSVKRASRRSSRSTPPGPGSPRLIPQARRSRNVGRSPRRASSKVALVAKPNPPSWISKRMTAWPNPLHSVAVSRTTNPVTQTADVAVNNASTNRARSPSAEAKGRLSRRVPLRMSTAKPRTKRSAMGRGRRGARGFGKRTASRAAIARRTTRSPGRRTCSFGRLGWRNRSTLQPLYRERPYWRSHARLGDSSEPGQAAILFQT